MAGPSSNLPPPPDGFVLDAAPAPPTPPAGFVVDGGTGQPPGVPAYVPPGVQGYDPKTGLVTHPVSPLHSAVTGAADTLTSSFGDEVAAGIATLLDKLPGWEGRSYAQNLAEIKGNEANEQAQNPKSYLAGQAAGLLTQGGLLGASGLSLGANAAKAGAGLIRQGAGAAIDNAALGALYGAGSGQDAKSRLTGALIGAGTGFVTGAVAPAATAGVTSALGKAISPFATNPARTAMVDALSSEGVPLTAGQKTGSRALQYAESELGGSKAQNVMDQQADAFTNAAMQKAGGSGLATPDNLQALHDQLGQNFESIAARNTLQADPQLGQDIGQTLNRYGQLLEPQQKGVIDNLASSIVQRISSNGGTMSGPEYQVVRSDLTRAVQGNRNNPNLSSAFRGLRDALDDNMARSMSPQDAQEWQQLRGQYGNYKTLERAGAAAGENAAYGRISPAQLRVAASAGRRGQYARGTGDLDALARSGQAVMSPLPQSGTAPRLAARNLGAAAPMLTGMGLGGAAGGYEGHGDLGSIAEGALAGAVAPRLVGSALMSRPGQAYLSNQLAAGGMLSPEANAIVNAMLARTATQPLISQ